MNIYEKLERLTAEKRNIEKQILETQVEIYGNFQKELDEMETGTFNRADNGYKVKIVKKETVTVDQAMAEAVGMAFKVKYSLDKKAFAALSKEQKSAVEDCLSTKPAKPTFTVEKIGEE